MKSLRETIVFCVIDKNKARRITYYTIAKGSSDNEVREKLKEVGEKLGVSIHVQHEDIFNAMHKI